MDQKDRRKLIWDIVKDRKKKREAHKRLVFYMYVLATFTLFVIAILNYIQGDKATADSCLYCSLAFVFFILVYSRFKKQSILTIPTLFIISYLTYTLMSTGGYEGFGIFWVMFITPLAYTCMDIRFALLLNSIRFVIILCCLWIPVDGRYLYPDSVVERFPFVYLLTVIITHLLRVGLTRTNRESAEILDLVVSYMTVEEEKEKKEKK